MNYADAVNESEDRICPHCETRYNIQLGHQCDGEPQVNCPKCNAENIVQIDQIEAAAHVIGVEPDGNVTFEGGTDILWDTAKPIEDEERFVCQSCGEAWTLTELIPMSKRAWLPHEALEAIRARLSGEYDHPLLVGMGPLGKQSHDLWRILERTEWERKRWI